MNKPRTSVADELYVGGGNSLGFDGYAEPSPAKQQLVAINSGATDLEAVDGLVITGGDTITVPVAVTDIIFASIPTADPSVAGQLWSNSGVVTVSAG
jgi:hypothetical protein